MARPIRETPILHGKDAIRFDKEMKQTERIDKRLRTKTFQLRRYGFKQFLNRRC